MNKVKYVVFPSDQPSWVRVRKLLSYLQRICIAGPENIHEIVIIHQELYDISSSGLPVGAKRRPFHKCLYRKFAAFLESMDEVERERIIRKVLPCVIMWAMHIDEWIPENCLAVSEQQCGKSVELARGLVAAIVACGFLCLFPDRRCDSLSKLNVINFNHFFNSLDSPSQQSKLRCILAYFDRLSDLGAGPPGVVTFSRQMMSKDRLPSLDTWLNCQEELCPLVIDHESCLDDTTGDKLQIISCDKMLGGGVLFKGAEQEEMMFSEYPEMLASLLFMERLQDNEALLIKGTEKFAQCLRHADGQLRFSGQHSDMTERDRYGNLTTAICSINALRATSPAHESPFKSADHSTSPTSHSEKSFLHDLNKTFVGFRLCQEGQIRRRQTFASPLVTEAAAAISDEEYYTAGEELDEEKRTTACSASIDMYSDRMSKQILDLALSDIAHNQNLKSQQETNPKTVLEAIEEANSDSYAETSKPLFPPSFTEESAVDIESNCLCLEDRRRSSNFSDSGASGRSSSSTKYSSSEFSSEFEEYYDGFQKQEVKHSTIQEENLISGTGDGGTSSEFAQGFVSQIIDCAISQATGDDSAACSGTGTDSSSSKALRTIVTTDGSLGTNMIKPVHLQPSFPSSSICAAENLAHYDLSTEQLCQLNKQDQSDNDIPYAQDVSNDHRLGELDSIEDINQPAEYNHSEVNTEYLEEQLADKCRYNGIQKFAERLVASSMLAAKCVLRELYTRHQPRNNNNETDVVGASENVLSCVSSVGRDQNMPSSLVDYANFLSRAIIRHALRDIVYGKNGKTVQNLEDLSARFVQTVLMEASDVYISDYYVSAPSLSLERVYEESGLVTKKQEDAKNLIADQSECSDWDTTSPKAIASSSIAKIQQLNKLYSDFADKLLFDCFSEAVKDLSESMDIVHEIDRSDFYLAQILEEKQGENISEMGGFAHLLANTLAGDVCHELQKSQRRILFSHLRRSSEPVSHPSGSRLLTSGRSQVRRRTIPAGRNSIIDHGLRDFADQLTAWQDSKESNHKTYSRFEQSLQKFSNPTIPLHFEIFSYSEHSESTASNSSGSRRSSLSCFKDTTLATFEEQLLNTSFEVKTDEEVSTKSDDLCTVASSSIETTECYLKPVSRSNSSDGTSRKRTRSEPSVRYDYLDNIVTSETGVCVGQFTIRITNGQSSVAIDVTPTTFGQPSQASPPPPPPPPPAPSHAHLHDQNLPERDAYNQSPQKIDHVADNVTNIIITTVFDDLRSCNGGSSVAATVDSSVTVSHRVSIGNFEDAIDIPLKKLEELADSILAEVIPSAVKDAAKTLKLRPYQFDVNRTRYIASGIWRQPSGDAASNTNSSSGECDPQFYALLQWAVSSYVGTPALYYFTFGHPELAQLSDVQDTVRVRSWTVHDLLKHLKQYCDDDKRTRGTTMHELTLFQSIIQGS